MMDIRKGDSMVMGFAEWLPGAGRHRAKRVCRIGRKIAIFHLCALLLGFAYTLPAAEVSLDEAVSISEGWMSARRFSKGAQIRRPHGGFTRALPNGRGRYHVVPMSDGGFVALAGDDTQEPILAFSETETPDCEPGSPLHALLSGTVESAERGGDAEKQASSRRWHQMRQSVRAQPGGGGTRASGATTPGRSSVIDVRRAPLIQTKWGQTVSAVFGLSCYNNYTPNRYPCGCGATALAQVLRHHRHPQGSVTPRTKVCLVDGGAYKFTLMGGVYDWAHMPADPWWPTSTERRAIGKLTFDCALALETSFRSNGSDVAVTKDRFSSVLKNVFLYRQAFQTSDLRGTALESVLGANLDAGAPVLLAIHNSATGGGHAVVADGYGIQDGRFYTHLNMGWLGQHDIWYCLPSIPTSDGSYDVISAVCHGILPKSAGYLVSGRVVDAKGRPLEGAQVSLKEASVKTDKSGIFAFVTSEKSGSLSAAMGGRTSASKSFKVSSRASWGTELVLDIPDPFTPPPSAPAVSLATALNCSDLRFTTDGAASWTTQSAVSHDGVSAAQSGAIGNSKSSSLKTTVTDWGWLSFWWRADCEDGIFSSDYLSFYLDASRLYRFTGVNQPWTSHRLFISTAGDHSVEWRYEKDWSFKSGKDCGWVDQVQWTSATRVVLDSAGGTVSSNTLFFVRGGVCGTLPEPRKEGALFRGWRDAAGHEVGKGDLLDQRSVTLTAAWAASLAAGTHALGDQTLRLGDGWYEDSSSSGQGRLATGTAGGRAFSASAVVEGRGRLSFTCGHEGTRRGSGLRFTVDGRESAFVSVGTANTNVVVEITAAGRHEVAWTCTPAAGCSCWLEDVVWQNGCFLTLDYGVVALPRGRLFVPTGDSVSLPAKIGTCGLVLKGWTADPAGGTLLPSALSPIADRTVYAVWRAYDLWPDDEPFSGSAACIYDGYLLQDGELAGTLQVKVSKTARKNVRDRTTGITSTALRTVVSANVYGLDGKKVAYQKGLVDWNSAGDAEDGRLAVTGLVARAREAAPLSLRLGRNGMSGTLGGLAVVGARNGMGVAGDAMQQDLSQWLGDWRAAFSDDVAAGPARLSLSVARKGAVKLAFVLPDGRAFSKKAQGIVGEDGFHVPCVAPPSSKSGPNPVVVDLQIGPDGVAETDSSTLGGLFAFGRVEAPVLDVQEEQVTLRVGEAFHEVVSVQDLAYPVKFSAKGLPKGLKLDRATGVISGRATKPGRYTAVIKASSSAKASLNDQATRVFIVE